MDPVPTQHYGVLPAPCYVASLVLLPASLQIFTLRFVYINYAFCLYPQPGKGNHAIAHRKLILHPRVQCFAITTPTSSLLSHMLLLTKNCSQYSVTLSIRAERSKCFPLSPSLLGNLSCSNWRPETPTAVTKVSVTEKANMQQSEWNRERQRSETDTECPMAITQ